MTKNCPQVSSLHLCNEELVKENQDFMGTGGVSKENRSLGFIPAFFDTETGTKYISCNKDGTQAVIHMLDGLPEALITERDKQNNIVSVKPSVIPGFIKEGDFYTREQAAELVQE
jgi:hypothetical protein